MLRSGLCDYSNAYILVKGTIKVTNTAARDQPNNAANKKIFKICAPFTNSIGRINNTKVDDTHDIDVVITMYNLIECSDIYKHLGFYGNTVEINSLSLLMLLLILMQIMLQLIKVTGQITGHTGNNGAKDLIDIINIDLINIDLTWS